MGRICNCWRRAFSEKAENHSEIQNKYLDHFSKSMNAIKTSAVGEALGIGTFLM